MKQGLYCSAGYNWFSIGSDAKVYQCNDLVYSPDPSTYLGNLIEDQVILRTEEYQRCPIQQCKQICDRHWARKLVYKDDQVVDFQDINNPSVYQGFSRPCSILWAPTWKCNFSCKYCILPQDKEVYKYEQWIEAFGKFFDLNKIDGGILHTNGGEPLFYPGIEKVFSFLHGRKFVIAITTNLSSDIWKTVIQAAPPSAYGAINCSLHATDKNFRWELFKSRIMALKAMDYPVSVNFVGHPDQLMLAPEYAAFFKGLGVNFALIPMIGQVDGFQFPTVDHYPLPLRQIIQQLTSEGLSDKTRFVQGRRVGL